MKSLDNIPRIEAVAPAEFLDRHLRPQIPVVLTNLYDGDPIAEVRTLESAAARWGALLLPVQAEYMTRANEGRGTGSELWRFGDFLGMSAEHPATATAVITEQETPAEILAMLSPPPYAELGGASLEDAVSKVFVAHAGHYAHLHFDMDGRPVFLTQVFGRKRVMVISPEHSQAIDPILEERGGNMSSRYLENLRSDERLELARELNAHDCILEPGETIFIPTAWWHYIDYVDTGMSFSYRIGRSDYQQRLFEVCEALESRHLHHWQVISQPFATGRSPSPELCALADRAIEALAAAREGTRPVSHFGEHVVALYRAIEPDAFSRALHTNDLARLSPIEELFDFESLLDPSLEGEGEGEGDEGEWSEADVPGLADGIEIAATLAEPPELIILRGHEAIFKIGSSSDGFDQVRGLLGRLCRGIRCPMSEHASALEIRNDDIAELLAELSEIGCVVKEV